MYVVYGYYSDINPLFLGHFRRLREEYIQRVRGGTLHSLLTLGTLHPRSGGRGDEVR